MTQRHLSAQRQARKALKRRARNRMYLSKMKTIIKRVRSAKEKSIAESNLKQAYKLIDQLAAKGIIHRNKAARQKSALRKFVSAMK